MKKSAIMKYKVTRTVRLSDEQYKFLKEIADKEDRTISYVIRRIVNNFMENLINKK